MRINQEPIVELAALLDLGTPIYLGLGERDAVKFVGTVRADKGQSGHIALATALREIADFLDGSTLYIDGRPIQ